MDLSEGHEITYSKGFGGDGGKAKPSLMVSGRGLLRSKQGRWGEVALAPTGFGTEQRQREGGDRVHPEGGLMLKCEPSSSDKTVQCHGISSHVVKMLHPLLLNFL